MSKTKNSASAATPEIAANATEANALPLNRLVLLGTFGDAKAPAALIRMPSGDVVKVTKGEKTKMGEVVGISDGLVIFAKHDRTTRLSMPN